jgi:hypothetical protein
MEYKKVRRAERISFHGRSRITETAAITLGIIFSLVD